MISSNFIAVVSSGYDIIINTNTIKFIERDPTDRENSTWIWTDWASDGKIIVNENIESLKEKLKAK